VAGIKPGLHAEEIYFSFSNQLKPPLKKAIQQVSIKNHAAQTQI